MNMHSKISQPFRAGLCAVVVAAALPLAASAARDRERHPGYVDGSAFAELAGEDGTLVEVSIHGPLLRQVARALSSRNKALGSFLDGIVSVTAVVVEEPRNRNEARQRMQRLAADLEAGHWDRVARVREGDEDVWVFVLYDEAGEDLNGLTVLVGESGEMIFVNLAGHIDLELVGELGVAADIPGLDELMDEDVVRELRKYEKRKSSKDSSKHRESRDGRSEGEDGR